MDAEEFRLRGKEMIDYVADYIETIRDRKPLPDVRPGYLQKLLPDKAPENGEPWEAVAGDIESVIMPGMVHWQHPNFHAYFPAATSYPSVLADIFTNTVAPMGFSWAASPVCTELEVVVLDWLGKMLNLPKEFLASSVGHGGGVIQSTASEAVLMAMLGARTRTLRKSRKHLPDLDDAAIMSKMVAYSSDQVHSAMEKACLVANIKYRPLSTDDNFALRGQTLTEAIQEDMEYGLIPTFVCASLGTTGLCAFDKTEELGKICEEHGIWMHIDAAYAGSAFICPEFRPILNGVEYAESFDFNPHKWLMVSHDCSTMWVKDSRQLTESFNVNPLFLQHENEGKMPDFRHWHIPLSRHFRSLKLWFVLRMYGQTGLQEHIRNDVQLAHLFESLVKEDRRFEIVGEVKMAIVCFRMKQSNDFNERLLKELNKDGRVHMVPAEAKGVYFLRMVICGPTTTQDDILYSWHVITEMAEKLMLEDS